MPANAANEQTVPTGSREKAFQFTAISTSQYLIIRVQLLGTRSQAKAPRLPYLGKLRKAVEAERGPCQTSGARKDKDP